MKILTFVDYYLPGFKAGGPIRTLSAMVSHLPADLEFFIVTRCRDHTETLPYRGIPTNEWVQVGRAKVKYLDSLTIAGLVALIRDEHPDVIYLNSLFSRITIRVLAARLTRLVDQIPVVLAPRGEFASSALQIRGLRKRLFLTVGVRLGLYKDLIWQASTDREKGDIMRTLGKGQSIRVSRNIAVAQDIFEHKPMERDVANWEKRKGVARFVFLSRVSPMKNLQLAIEIIGMLAGDVSLDIFGPVDDEAYGQKCKAAMRTAGPNVRFAWHGSVDPCKVATTISEFQFFVLPTLGENFGHVVLEALSAGCPIVLSDRTPWKQLQADGVGWSLPLEDKGQWRRVLQSCVDMDNTQYQGMREKAPQVAHSYAERDTAIAQNVALFQEAIRRA